MEHYMFIDDEKFKEKEKINKFDLSYIKWNTKECKYVPLNENEKKGLEVLVLNDLPDGMKILNSIYKIIRSWNTSSVNPQGHIALMLQSKSFLRSIIFIYGKNLRSSAREVFSYGSLTEYGNIEGEEERQGEVRLSINIAYPKSQVSREIREEGIIGGAGSNTRHSMISYVFNKLNCKKVTTQVVSDKAYKALLDLGFVVTK